MYDGEELPGYFGYGFAEKYKDGTTSTGHSRISHVYREDEFGPEQIGRKVLDKDENGVLKEYPAVFQDTKEEEFLMTEEMAKKFPVFRYSEKPKPKDWDPAEVPPGQEAWQYMTEEERRAYNNAEILDMPKYMMDHYLIRSERRKIKERREPVEEEK